MVVDVLGYVVLASIALAVALAVSWAGFRRDPRSTFGSRRQRLGWAVSGLRRDRGGRNSGGGGGGD